MAATAFNPAGTGRRRDRLDDIMLRPLEAFGELVDLAIETGRPELLRGCRMIDTGSITDTLLIYEAEVECMITQVARQAGARAMVGAGLRSRGPHEPQARRWGCWRAAQPVRSDGGSRGEVGPYARVERQKRERDGSTKIASSLMTSRIAFSQNRRLPRAERSASSQIQRQGNGWPSLRRSDMHPTASG